MSTYELYHHGILGMKWGVRRYQNRDGSLTAKGKKRYGKDGVTSEASTPKQTVVKKPPVKRLTNEELQEKQNRLQLEKRVLELENDIRKLTMPQVAQTPQAQKGKGAVKEMLGKKATELLGEGADAVGKWALGKVLEKAGIKAGADEMDMLKRDAEKWKNKADILRNRQYVEDYADSHSKEARESKKRMDDMNYEANYAQSQWKKSKYNAESAKYEADYEDYQKYKQQKNTTSTESKTKADYRNTSNPSVINMTQDGERWVASFLNIDPDLKPRK